jgi:DNA-binding transcriptional LysR family regulator
MAHRAARARAARRCSSARGVVLSQAGRVLLPHAERVLAALEDCAAALGALRSGSAGPVSVAAVGTLASTELTPILGRFAARHPDVELTLRTATSVEVSDLVRRGEATLGLRYLRDPSPDVVCEALPPEGLVVACGSRHRFAGKRVASLAELAAEAWLAFPSARGKPKTCSPSSSCVASRRCVGLPSTA